MVRSKQISTGKLHSTSNKVKIILIIKYSKNEFALFPIDWWSNAKLLM